MDNILVLKPTDEIKEIVQSSADKFKGIFSANLELDFVPNIVEASKLFDVKKFQLIFLCVPLEEADVNRLLDELITTKQNTVVVGFKRNTDFLKEGLKNIPGTRKFNVDNIYDVIDEYSKEFVYDCLRNLLPTEDREIDIRVVQHILKSVIDVVKQNTQETMVPAAISKTRNETTTQDFSTITTFWGDGILGALTITTNNAVLTKFTTQMFGCTEEEIQEGMLEDLVSEISAQILGVVRNNLGEYGYELSQSMTLVVSAENHMQQAKATGKYYLLPFKCQGHDFIVSFCYDTYKGKIGSSKSEKESKKKKQSFDVRVVNLALAAIKDVVASNTSLEVQKVDLKKHEDITYKSTSFHTIHLRGSEGSLSIGLEVPREAAQELLKAMFGVEDEVDPEMLIDTCTELCNQIAGTIRERAKAYDYNFFKILYHGGFAVDPEVLYLLKNPGNTLRAHYTINGKPFTAFLGLASGLGGTAFDLWDYLSKNTPFNTKEAS